MPIRRGVIYEFSARGAEAVGLLVLTNDRWNDSRMKGVGVVPVRRSRPDSPQYLRPVSIDSPPLQVLSTRLLSLDRSLLGRALTVLDECQMAQVEDALCDILALDRLCVDLPEPPPTVPGQVGYPQWGDVYYAGDPIDGEYKRHVVVSIDSWNRQSQTPILVRTTSQTRRSGDAFPAIENGSARACCAEATAMPVGKIRRSRNERPWPPTLNRWDMGAIARGLASTFELWPALERRR